MKKWSGYHRRSLVEAKMHCIKLLGDKLMARSFLSKVNEIHACVAVLNKFTELGRPEPYRVCRRVNILRDYPDDKIKIYP